MLVFIVKSCYDGKMQQKTVFVVDDIGMNLSMAEQALEEQYRVITLSSAANMFKILEKVIPDLILLDIEMPDMDGYETLKCLKTSDTYSGIPVIFITATINADIEASAQNLGAAAILLKPFSRSKLRDYVKQHIVSD